MSTIREDDLYYSTIADDPLLGNIVRMYVEEMPERIATLIAAHASGDRGRLTMLAHQITGSAGSHGFRQVTLVAGQLEKLARGDASPDEIERAVQALVEACGRVR